MIPKPELAEGSILIRPYRPEDVEPTFAAVCESIDELSPWLPWCHANYAIAETREFVQFADDAWMDETDFCFALLDAASGEHLGGVGLNQINRVHNFANLGYWVRTSACGRGIASRCLRRVARWTFAELRFNRIEIVVAVANKASLRVAEKAGAQREGLLRRRLAEGTSDAVLFSLVPEDFGFETGNYGE
jgi:ribosomal-protein-serine acetyltransferase